MLFQNLRHTLRLLRTAPGFTAVTVSTLALGIGANTAVFSVVDAVMLKPLPYFDPDRLVIVREGRSNRSVSTDVTHGSSSAVAPANLVDYSRENRSFESLAGYARSSMSLTRSGPPEQLIGEAITWNYFATLGVLPGLGRPFLPEEDRPGRPHVVILTDSLWRSRFGADPSIVGRSIVLNGESYSVVGVTPPAFEPLTQFGSSTPVAFVVPAAYPDDLLANHGDHEINVVGRLKPGVSIGQAQADLTAIAGRLAERYPSTAGNLLTVTSSLASEIARDVRTSLLLLVGAVGLMLLVACINVANLMIVRAVGQRREVAIRLAIGASRRQIVADMMTRGLVLGILGGAAGLLFGTWIRDGLVGIAPTSIPRLEHLELNSRVLVTTIALSMLTGIIASVLPAWQASRTDPAPALKVTEPTVSRAGAILRWRGMLMAGEVAAAVVLGVAAGLLIKSLLTLNRVDLGFQTERVLAANIVLPEARYADANARLRFFEEFAGRVKRLPGVEAVAFANRLPMRGGWSSGFVLDGIDTGQRDAEFQAVSPGYFATLGIPLVRGRLLTDDDRAGTQHVAVVSQAFVRKLLGDRDPVGQTFRRDGPGAPTITIVGVVSDVRRGGRSAVMQPEVYLSAAQTDVYPVRIADVAVRAAGDPHILVAAIERAVWAIDPDQPLTNVKTLDEVLSTSMSQRQFELILLTSFAALAVGLAVVGVYGVVAYAASGRAREIGIRIALGATTREVIALVVRSGLNWATGGVVVGLAAAWTVTRLMTGLLFGVTSTDPATFAGMALLMLVAAAGASYIPARRAATIDPIRALRAE
jgi:putative ABC transport system permease protein